MRHFFLRFLLLGCCLGGVAVGLTLLLREQLFHPVEARCLSGEWVDGGTKRGFAILQLQYSWAGRTYDNVRIYGPLDDSDRFVQTAADVLRGRDWIAAECRPQPAWIMHGQPGVAWFHDARSWNSVIVQVALRSLGLAALAAAAWTLLGARSRRRSP